MHCILIVLTSAPPTFLFFTLLHTLIYLFIYLLSYLIT